MRGEGRKRMRGGVDRVSGAALSHVYTRRRERKKIQKNREVRGSGM